MISVDPDTLTTQCPNTGHTTPHPPLNQEESSPEPIIHNEKDEDDIF